MFCTNKETLPNTEVRGEHAPEEPCQTKKQWQFFQGKPKPSLTTGPKEHEQRRRTEEIYTIDPYMSINLHYAGRPSEHAEELPSAHSCREVAKSGMLGLQVFRVATYAGEGPIEFTSLAKNILLRLRWTPQ